MTTSFKDLTDREELDNCEDSSRDFVETLVPHFVKVLRNTLGDRCRDEFIIECLTNSVSSES